MPWLRKLSAGGTGAVLVVVLMTGSAPSASAQAPLADWLSRADGHVEDIHRAENAAFAILESDFPIDTEKLRAGCTQLHDANEALRNTMPTPDPKLTVEVQQAIDNFDSAAQSCIDAMNTGYGDLDEFMSFLKTAEQHFSSADTILVALARAG